MDGFELITRRLVLVTRVFELVTRGLVLVTRVFELVTRNSRFTFPLISLSLPVSNYEVKVHQWV